MTGLEIADWRRLNNPVCGDYSQSSCFRKADRQIWGQFRAPANHFWTGGKACTLDAILSKWTKITVFSFFILVFIGMLITKFFGA